MNIISKSLRQIEDISLKSEIEKILQADDAARETVEAARTEARRIREEARREAEEITARRERELSLSVTAEVDRILGEGRSRAGRAREDADRYLKSLRERMEAVWPELIAELMERVMKI